MIRKILLVFSFSIYLFALGQTNRENMIHFATLSRIEVINEQIYQLLDSLILYNKDCIYTVCSKPYFFEIVSYKKENDTTIIYTSSCQYFSTTLWDKNDWAGYFYYKNNLVVIGRFEIFSLFFKNTSDTKKFYHKKYDRRKDIAYYDYLGLEYYYIKNEFIPKFKSLCAETSPYFHIVRKKDTWKNIANRYGITIRELKSLNKIEKNKLPKLYERMNVKIR